MIFATQNHRPCRLTTALAILALVAVMFFVAAPYLIKNHHHSDFEGDALCALCLFASAQIDAARPPMEANNPFFLIGELSADDESPRTLLLSHTDDARAPPAV
jgi:hypothetical protein